MKLISATPSPYARKIRIALAEKSVPFELQTEVPWNEGTSLPRHNPLEKLPVLILDDGSTIWESSYILEWVERKHPQPPLLPSDDDGILAHKRMDALATGVCDAFLLVFFERMRPEAYRSQLWTDRQLRKIHGGVAEIARVVGDHAFAVREAFGIADISAGSVLGYLDVRFPELGWRATHPNLARYLDGLMTRPSFRDTAPYPQTISGPVVWVCRAAAVSGTLTTNFLWFTCGAHFEAEKMRNGLRTLTGVVVLSAAIGGVNVAPTLAQTTTMESPSQPARPHHRVTRHRTPSVSAPARNVGPTSSALGDSGNSLGASRSGNDGLPSVPGAPSAGGNGSTGGH